MKILAFAASNSLSSINGKLAHYAANLMQGEIDENAEIEFLELSDYELPLYRADREEADGVPAKAQEFYDKIGASDALIISFAEHNGGYVAAYKNLFDWASRIDMKVFQGKSALIMSTSPGPGGASSVLKAAEGSAGFFGMDLKGAVSVPKFFDHFDGEKGMLTSAEHVAQIKKALQAF